MKYIKYGSLILVALSLAACNATVPSKMVNTSPESSIQDVQGFKTIPASLSIKSDKPDFVSDVTVALNRHKVFSEISPANGKLQLVVRHETNSDHHVAEGMGDAFISGLSFGLSGDTPDQFDYSITVNADLKYRNKVISSYKTQGSYHSEVSSSAGMNSKVQRTTEVVLKSFDHALNLLAVKIKQDRNKIITAMK